MQGMQGTHPIKHQKRNIKTKIFVFCTLCHCSGLYSYSIFPSQRYRIRPTHLWSNMGVPFRIWLVPWVMLAVVTNFIVWRSSAVNVQISIHSFISTSKEGRQAYKRVTWALNPLWDLFKKTFFSIFFTSPFNLLYGFAQLSSVRSLKSLQDVSEVGILKTLWLFFC